MDRMPFDRPSDVPRTSILFVDPEAVDAYVPALRARFEVTTAAGEAQATRALHAFRPTLVVTELTLPDGDGVAICRRSASIADNRPVILATTSLPERVPDALAAGCDAVLLKPFPPNLLYARIGRLLRQRAQRLCDRAHAETQRAASLVAQARHLKTRGSNVVWRDSHCPDCGRGDAISFDSAGGRGMWYACLPCRKVWIGPRRYPEDLK